MDALISSLLPIAMLDSLAAMPVGPYALPALLAAVTASLVAMSVPGAVNTMSFLSGLILGIAGILVVALGVTIGTHLLFLASRRWLGERFAAASANGWKVFRIIWAVAARFTWLAPGSGAFRM